MKVMAWIIAILVFLMAFMVLVASKAQKHGSSLEPWEMAMPFILMIAICLVICFVIHIIKVDKEEKEKEKREREEREREIERKRQEAEAIITRRTKSEQRVVELVNNSAATSETLVERVKSANVWLDTAEQDFKEGVFAPFWDDVENTITSLANFDSGVKQITEYSEKYKMEVRALGSVPAVFDWDKAVDIPDAKLIADRLRGIVRTAQKSPVFAVIYEQRKTNQLLSIGFANLAQALNEIGRRIDESTYTLSMSISDLSQVVSETSAKEIEAGKQDAQAIVKGTQAIKGQIESDAKTRQAHEEKEMETLTDLQKAYRRVHRDELEHKI